MVLRTTKFVYKCSLGYKHSWYFQEQKILGCWKNLFSCEIMEHSVSISIYIYIYIWPKKWKEILIYYKVLNSRARATNNYTPRARLFEHLLQLWVSCFLWSNHQATARNNGDWFDVAKADIAITCHSMPHQTSRHVHRETENGTLHGLTHRIAGTWKQTSENVSFH